MKAAMGQQTESARCVEVVRLKVPVSRAAPDGHLTLRCHHLAGHSGHHHVQTDIVWPVSR